jgi:hypothetical protein
MITKNIQQEITTEKNLSEELLGEEKINKLLTEIFDIIDKNKKEISEQEKKLLTINSQSNKLKELLATLEKKIHNI